MTDESKSNRSFILIHQSSFPFAVPCSRDSTNSVNLPPRWADQLAAADLAAGWVIRDTTVSQAARQQSKVLWPGPLRTHREPLASGSAQDQAEVAQCARC
jgi:hypothetical protein